VRYVTERQTII